MRWLAAIVILAAWAASLPASPILAAQYGRPPIVNHQSESRNQSQQANREVGQAESSPLYVKATCEHGCGYSQDNKGWWDKLWTDPVASFTAVLAILTLGLIIVGGVQSRLTRIAIDDARKSNERQLRAYVHQIEINWWWHTDPSSGSVWYSFKPLFQNLGSTPAHAVKIFTSKYLEKEDIPKHFSFKGTDVDTVAASGPQAKFVGAEITANGSDLAAVQSGQLYFLIWGWAKYRDAFEDTPERITKFCVRVGVRGNPLVVPTDKEPLVINFIFYSDQNTAT